MKKFPVLLFFLISFCVPVRGEAVVIETAEQLAGIDEGGEYVLAGDIELAGGVEVPVFRGIFDGGGYTVRGLTRAMFDETEGAEIRNLVICGAEISAVGEGGAAGALVNRAADTVFENITVRNADISGSYGAGGVIGHMNGGSFTNGVAEFIYVRGVENVGGFAGHISGNAVVRNCVVAARVGDFDVFVKSVPGRNIGGFAGKISGRGWVKHSVANSVVAGGLTATGGFVGELTGASRIEFSAATGDVTGGQAVGGFAGIVSDTDAPNTITDCLALGKAVVGLSEETTRRFAGYLAHDGINNCYANLGMVVVAGERLSHVMPNPFGQDGGDLPSFQNFKVIAGEAD